MGDKETNPTNNNDKHVNRAQSDLNGLTPPMRTVSSFAGFRSNQSFDEIVQSAKEFSVELGFPKDDRYFRVHPGAEYEGLYWTYQATYRAPLYLVHNNMLKEFRSRAKKMFFAPWVDTPGTLGLLYVPCSTDAWSDSKMRIVEVARKRWLRMEKNEKETAWAPCYPDPKSDLGEPNFPVDKTLDDYLQAAFGDYLIIDETHLVVRRLRGLTKY